jgi:uncharacterized lipoprotein NlpE involved in copper resistance
MNKVFFILGLLIIGGLGLPLYFHNQPALVKKEEVVKTQEASISATFKANLPCADCSGIESTLIINKDNTYQRTDVYTGKDVKPYQEKGMWVQVKGIQRDPKATIYQFKANGATTSQNYLMVNDNQLKSLNSQLKEIDSPFDQSYKKL